MALMDKPPKAPNKFVFTFLIAESVTVTVSANTLNQADKAARNIIPDQHPVIPNTCQLISVIERELYSVQK
jgi:hypothetical protein